MLAVKIALFSRLGMSSTTQLQGLLDARQYISTSIAEANAYSPFHYYARSVVYAKLGYPDLAVMDAYKALLLVDEAVDESGEYHEQASNAVDAFLNTNRDHRDQDDLDQELVILREELSAKSLPGSDSSASVETLAEKVRVSLLHHLTTIGCLRSAYVFVHQLQSHGSQSVEAVTEMQRFLKFTADHFREHGQGFDPEALDPNTLPDRGVVRREIYPWNLHEQDRNSAQALEILNKQMMTVSSKLKVKVVELPVLTNDPGGGEVDSTVKQLGVFATQNIEPGEEIFCERSLLTANARFHEPLCDACSGELPALETVSRDQSKDVQPTVACEDCDDIVFCSQACHDLAQNSYHTAVCGMDVESIAKEVPPAELADSLYTLLLLRSLAMAQTQEIHPLDLQEVKYIWGDFVKPADPMLATSVSTVDEGDAYFFTCERTLPFSFSANILLPLHMLEKMDLNIFESVTSASTGSLEFSELWVLNTLYAKFRGTASGRVNPNDGKPEVAAVHPLWCLANHSCDPNVQWEWAGEIKFTCRKKRVAWSKQDQKTTGDNTKPERPGGIKKDEEILNHYVDIQLPVAERREWGAGALGGHCLCERCQFEAGN